MNKITPKFKCRIDQGELRYEPRIKDARDGYLKTLPDGFYTVTIKKFSLGNTRSNQQNRYYWGVVVQLVSDTTGYDEDESHKILKEECLKKPMKIGRCKMVNIPQSTTGLSTVDMENYLERCRRWAATELQISIPEPNEIDYEEI